MAALKGNYAHFVESMMDNEHAVCQQVNIVLVVENVVENNIDMMHVHYLACSSQNVRGYLMIPGTYVTKCYTNFLGVGLFLTTHRHT